MEDENNTNPIQIIQVASIDGGTDGAAGVVVPPSLEEISVDMSGMKKVMSEAVSAILQLKEQNKNGELTIKTLKEEISKSSFEVTQISAIFVSLFTFISVEFQIFKSEISVNSGISFTLILLGGLTMFLFAIKIMSDKENKNNILGFFALVLILLGVFFFLVGEKNKNEKYYNKEEVNEMIKSSEVDPFLMYKKCLSEGISSAHCVNLQK